LLRLHIANPCTADTDTSLAFKPLHSFLLQEGIFLIYETQSIPLHAFPFVSLIFIGYLQIAVPASWPKGGSGADIFFWNEGGNAEVFEANSRRMFTNDGIFNVEACFMNSSGMTFVVGFEEHNLIRLRKQT